MPKNLELRKVVARLQRYGSMYVTSKGRHPNSDQNHALLGDLCDPLSIAIPERSGPEKITESREQRPPLPLYTDGRPQINKKGKSVVYSGLLFKS
jgi:hypothetical protein